MINTLSSFEYLPEGWPVRLSEGVDRNTGAFFEMEGEVVLCKSPELAFLDEVEQSAATSTEQTNNDPVEVAVPPPSETVTEPVVPELVESLAPRSDEPLQFSEGIWVHDQGETMSKTQGQGTLDPSLHFFSLSRVSRCVLVVTMNLHVFAEWARENLKEKDGSLTDGTFALRRHKTENAYVLELVYKQRMTSHMIEVEADVGIISIGKKQYGFATTFDTLINSLATAPLPQSRQGRPWPVQLVQGLDPDTMQLVAVPMGNSAGSVTVVPQERYAAAARPLSTVSVEAESPPPRPPKNSAPKSAAAHSGQSWFHGISQGKDEDAAKLRDPVTLKYTDGHFFVCAVDKESSSHPAVSPATRTLP